MNQIFFSSFFGNKKKEAIAQHWGLLIKDKKSGTLCFHLGHQNIPGPSRVNLIEPLNDTPGNIQILLYNNKT